MFDRKRHRSAGAIESCIHLVFLCISNRVFRCFQVRRVLWKVAKGTWKAFKIGFKTTVTNQPFSVALEPTAIATTIAEYRVYKRNHR